MNTKEHMELHPENLRSLADVPPEERKRIQSNGGKKGAETKRRKKMMSDIYSKFLSHRYNIKVGEEVKKLSGEKMLLEVIGAIIMRKDSASVAMQHEIRETLEGNKINLSGKSYNYNLNKDTEELTPEENKAYEEQLSKAFPFLNKKDGEK